ncbi:MAG: transcription elongation factor GreA [Bacilli bacterium]|nr:transcription elongation factor GreA [Bacilli bacterium]
MNKKYSLTQEGLKKYQEELQNLKDVERVKNIQDLKDARAQGDLSENADYDAARNRQAEIEGRIRELENIIKNHVIIDVENRKVDDNVSNLGKTVKIRYLDDDDELEVTIVGSLESNPVEGKISNESPLGLAILSAKVNDVVEVKTENDSFKVKILNIK